MVPSEQRIRALGEQFGDDAVRRLETWGRLLKSPDPGATEEQRVTKLHRFLALLPYVSDREQWNVTERWATPIELLTTNGGDCEDFAIARYFGLRELGVPPDRLQLAYVHLQRTDPPRVEPHMVLLYWPAQGADALVLDNFNPELLTASQRPDLTPVYSFNEERLWVASRSARLSDPRTAVATPARIGRWQDLVGRMNGGG